MASKVRINLQIEDTSPLVREIIGSLKGEKGWTNTNPDNVVKVTYTVTAGEVEVINEGIYYSIPTITTAKEGDTAFSDDFRLFVYDEAGARWRLWASADKDDVKIYHNNTLIGDGTQSSPLGLNPTIIAFKGDLNPLLKGEDNGDGTYTFTKFDGTDSFIVDTNPKYVENVEELRNTIGRADGQVITLKGYKDISNCLLHFNGVDSYAEISDANKFDAGTQSIDVEVKFRTISTAPNLRILDKRGTGAAADTPGYCIGVSNGTWNGVVLTPNGATSNIQPFGGVGFSQNDGKWHTVRLRFENSTGRVELWIDGEVVSYSNETSLAGADLTSTVPLTIGNTVTHDNLQFSGEISYVRVRIAQNTEQFFIKDCGSTSSTSIEGTSLDFYNTSWITEEYKSGGGGLFTWDADNTNKDDKGLVFNPGLNLLNNTASTPSIVFNGVDDKLTSYTKDVLDIDFPISVKFRNEGTGNFHLLGKWGSGQTPDGYVVSYAAATGFGLGTRTTDYRFPYSIVTNGEYDYLAEIDSVTGDLVQYMNGVEQRRDPAPIDIAFTNKNYKFEVGNVSQTVSTPLWFEGRIFYFRVGNEEFYPVGNISITGSEGTVLDYVGSTVNSLPGRWVRENKIELDIRDFGAVGDFYTNDTFAFQYISNVVRERSGGKVIIPEGTYLVGKQTENSTGKYWRQENIMRLTGCVNPVLVEGLGSRIVADNGLRYGSFSPNTGERYNPTLPFTNEQYATSSFGNIIATDNSRQVTIRNIILDGNSHNVILGGQWGDTGRQIQSSGLQHRTSTHKVCSYYAEGVKSINNPLDGCAIGVRNMTEGDADTPMTFINCEFSYNARQGVSFVGGKRFQAINCTFSNTGQNTFGSAPQSGFDIEATSSICRDTNFTSCNFVGNRNTQLVADSGSTLRTRATGCKFISSDGGRALWMRRPGFVADSCIFVGNIPGLQGGPKGSAPIFKNCLFSNNPNLSPTGRVTMATPYLIDENNAGVGLTFEDCTFEAHTHRLVWIRGGGHLRNCTLRIWTDPNRDYGPTPDGSYIMQINSSCILEDVLIQEIVDGDPPTNPYYIGSGGGDYGGARGRVYLDAQNIRWSSSNGWTGFSREVSYYPVNRQRFTRNMSSASTSILQQIRYNTKEPTDGDWVQGDLCLNSDQAANPGIVGWQCVTSGAAGVDAVFEEIVNAAYIDDLPGVVKNTEDTFLSAPKISQIINLTEAEKINLENNTPEDIVAGALYIVQ